MGRKRVVIATLLMMLALSFAETSLGAGAGIGGQQTPSLRIELGGEDANSVLQPQGQGPTDPAELEAFLDDLMAWQMPKYHVAGAAVSVVRDGRLLFAKGYGYADLENRIPVDPEQTSFRIGSVTKLFTGTAVMQLVEQGKLDLDADINTYLDFPIPDTYPQPVTLKHLLAHTSGFEEQLSDLLASNANDLVPAREWLLSHMHARVRPPGDTVAYSDFNTSLAGYIVARVSGLPYDQYIQENILDPLGMVHTTARSPMPPDLRDDLSVGYTFVDGVFHAYPDYMGQLGMIPSGGMVASVTDMARFMIAHLQDGRYSDANTAETRILEATTAQQMHSTLYTPDPRLLGNAHGFFDFSDNGQRTIGHSGDAPPMNGLLLLLPGQNLGVYVVYNSEGGGELTNQHLGFQRAFFDHYYPVPPTEPLQPPADFAGRAGRFEGSYRITRGSSTNLEKLMGLLVDITISDAGDDTLLLNTPYGEWRMVEVDPLYFRDVDGRFGFAFREDGQGRITQLSTDITPMFAFEKLAWYETPGFNMALALACVLVFLSIIPVVLVRFARNRRLSDDRKSTPRETRLAHWLILAISVLNLLFLSGMVLWVDLVPLYGASLNHGIVLGLGALAAVLTVGALVYTVLAWKNRYWGIAARVNYTLATVAAIAFVWFLNQWNLLGWRF